MVRFQCIHCGGRIAVPDDHMDRLAQCPDCGGVTHPLAEHLSAPKKSGAISASALAPSKTAPADPETAPCANCGGPLGKLQTPFEWDGHFVCGPCHRMLSLDQAAKSQPEIALAGREKESSVAVPSIVEPIVVDVSKKRTHPTDLALAIRTICIGLVIMAVTLWVIVSILQSLGYLIMWGAIGIVVLAAIYWTRKGVLAIRRRARGFGMIVRD